MTSAPNPTPAPKPRYDILIVGAGVLGLWAARHLVDAGLSVALVDKGAAGGGASGGILGALLPHMPSGWNAKKQFQFDALAALPEIAARLKEETGIDTGYWRCGRISPIRRPGFLRQTESHVARHKDVWRAPGLAPDYRHAEVEKFSHWIDAAAAPLGLAHETLAAAIDPRAYCQALKASLGARADIFEGVTFQSYDAGRGLALLAGLGEIEAGHLLLTAGFETFPLLAPYLGAEVGGGVRGEAALFAADIPADVPIIYDDGVYVVPKADGRLAVGSTSEPLDEMRLADSGGLDAIIAKAKVLCPALRGARLLETWSGVRPRCHAKDPLVGRLPGRPIYVATGGFKITLGIAHHMARALADIMLAVTEPLSLPESYTMTYHLDKLEERRDAARAEAL